MQKLLTALYFRFTLLTPAWSWATVILLLLFAVYFAQDFKLDASADALVLESDQDLRYYRAIRARYGSDDFLVVTYRPQGDLFAKETLADITNLRGKLQQLERVASVTSLLDVPLIDSPRMTLSELQQEIRTLETPDMDTELARREFRDSPLYRNLLVSPDGHTTAMLVNLRHNSDYQTLLTRRDALWEKRLHNPLSAEEINELSLLSGKIKNQNEVLQAQQKNDIATVRGILQQHRQQATIHLGGVPMISADMVDFIRSDIRVFGLGVGLFLIVLLATAFKQLRWVLVPMLICVSTAVMMVGFLGLMDWPVTVVSSNFISLMLILTLSLVVHLIVRHQELHVNAPEGKQGDMLRETVRSKIAPSIYTSLTTIVAFASLIVSGIRPVMDFGWMMVVGVSLAFVLVFLLFPALLIGLQPGTPIFRKHDATAVITRFFARIVTGFPKGTLLVYVLLVVLGVVGISRLTVENRFIDYFKDSTEIHQGMLLIDRELGGTTPLDVVLEPPKVFFEAEEEATTETAGTDSEDFFDDLLMEDLEQEDAGLSGSSYWYNIFQLRQVEQVHAYLEALPETGKVLSLATTMAMMTQLNKDEPLDNLSLAVMHKNLPADVKTTLFDPYLSEEGNQIRFAVRVIDSDKNLQRDALIKKIRAELIAKFKLEPEQVHLSGMLVLYNNVLQSLFRSQILTLSVVFLAIMLMLLLLFQSLKFALIGVVPTMVAATSILGLMGWLGIPLDIMTITIAAITIGIGVDNSIHYIHRFREEFAKDGNGNAAAQRCHASVGRALYYTSVTITLGFSILALSNFIPSIYFGLLTGIAMIVALVANLTLLPVLLVRFNWKLSTV
ncbi:efflux RND transporter permease subunit [Candidatus Venteria ishoeyi]|uniref:Putative membrane protein YdgH n=2 Tax=Candidatus Venteria ishoeyi TaxID=1899563 RepID=A0A1H6FAC6_9GAMM|nr:MMPL family transporter [Candidatus Venteria ishoeyi]SEH05984.1 Putative membrane protein YdgH [Candidatus Venteria ishoeyi]